MKTLSLRIPDTATLEADLTAPPFALWDVVDQPLLFHWFDFAVDQRFGAVRILCPSRLATAVARKLAEATLWPVELSLQAAGDKSGGADFTADHLPDSESAPEVFDDPFASLDWHARMVRNRLDHLWNALIPRFPYLARGPRSAIHPSVEIIEPYWIGEGVRIGAGTEIGPGACIGSRVRIGAGSSVAGSGLASGIEVPPDTHFHDHTVTGDFVYNHRMGFLHRRHALETPHPALAA